MIWNTRCSVPKPITTICPGWLLLSLSNSSKICAIMNTYYHRLVTALVKHIWSCRNSWINHLVHRIHDNGDPPQKDSRRHDLFIQEDSDESIHSSGCCKKISTGRIRIHTPATHRFKAESIPNNLVLERAEIYQNRCSCPGMEGEPWKRLTLLF